MSSTEKVYRQFLIYSTFYAVQTPVVICEGGTDIVYLTHAIRSLAGEFPDLAEVRLYKYPRSSTARLVGLKDGGVGGLCNFIAAYKKETSHFTGPGPTNPVVFLYDNDTGASAIQKEIKKIGSSGKWGGGDVVGTFRIPNLLPVRLSI